MLTCLQDDLNPDDIARYIKEGSKKYVENYWRKKAGEKVKKEDEVTFEDLLENFKDMKNSKIKGILDEVAKKNISTYYNMLLPPKVFRSMDCYLKIYRIYTACVEKCQSIIASNFAKY